MQENQNPEKRSSLDLRRSPALLRTYPTHADRAGPDAFADGSQSLRFAGSNTLSTAPLDQLSDSNRRKRLHRRSLVWRICWAVGRASMPGRYWGRALPRVKKADRNPTGRCRGDDPVAGPHVRLPVADHSGSPTGSGPQRGTLRTVPRLLHRRACGDGPSAPGRLP